MNDPLRIPAADEMSFEAAEWNVLRQGMRADLASKMEWLEWASELALPSRRKMLARLQKALDPAESHCVQMRYCDNLTIEEIAQRLGKNEHAARDLLQCARASMKSQLERHGLCLDDYFLDELPRLAPEGAKH